MRLLFVSEAVTLAHVARPVALAEILHGEDNFVTLATDPRYAAVVGPRKFDVRPLRSMSAERFRRAVSRVTPIFDEDVLSAYVADELRLFDDLAPDVVIGDFRASLSISARVAGVPYVNLTNAYFSPYARVPYVVPEVDLVRLIGVSAAQVVYDGLRRAFYALHCLPLNRVRRRYGLSALPLDVRYGLCDGDFTCYADLPAVIPTAPLPPTHRFIGPVPWSPPVEVPAFWDEVLEKARTLPVIYATMGSSGPPAALGKLLHALATLPVIVVAATANATVNAGPPNAYLTDYLPGEVACELADVVICNGGSPATYQALAAGKPAIGLATNMDQFLNMAAVERAGCGVLIRSLHFSPDQLRCTVEQALFDSRMRARAAEMKGLIAATEPAAQLAQLLRAMARAAVRRPRRGPTDPRLAGTVPGRSGKIRVDAPTE
jgi:UDP:flavonoid glycosyltransferase YjiC (YdhE family)